MNMLAQIAFEQLEPVLPQRNVTQAVDTLLSLPDQELDYARAKVALDTLVEPGADTEWAFAELDRLTAAAREMAGTDPAELDKLRAVRTVLYEPGPWNGSRPFRYDHDNSSYVEPQLLSYFLKSGRGSCVPMPILFLIVAERLGLDVALVCAPNHFFVRYTNADGETFDLETTSGANPARLE